MIVIATVIVIVIVIVINMICGLMSTVRRCVYQARI